MCRPERFILGSEALVHTFIQKDTKEERYMSHLLQQLH